MNKQMQANMFKKISDLSNTISKDNDKIKKLCNEYKKNIKQKIKNIDDYFDFLNQAKELLKNDKSKNKDDKLETIKKEIDDITPERMKYLVEKQKMAGKSKAKIIENCQTAQVAIQEDMKKVLGSHLDTEGLAFATKSLESFTRKVTDEWLGLKEETRNKKYKNNIYNFIRATIKDAIRYTANTTIDDLYQDWKRISDGLKNEGYKCIKVGNYWLNDNSSYKGVNTAFESPYGYNIEIQFHTPEDKQIWHDNHILYEEERKKETSPERKRELHDLQMQKVKNILEDKTTGKLLVPKNIEKVKL